MSWRARRHLTVGRPRARIAWWWTAVLLALNAAVMWFHGDPRRLLERHAAAAAAKSAASETRLPAAPASAPGKATVRFFWPRSVGLWLWPQAHAGTPAELAAPERFVGPPPRLEPLTDIRTPGPIQRAERAVLGAGRTAASALVGAGVSDVDAHGILQALSHTLDVRRLRAGDTFSLRFDASGRVINGDLNRGPMEQILFRRGQAGFVAERQRIAIDTVLQEVTGEVRSSLWESLIAAGEDPRLAQQLVDIFAYEVDFYSEVRAGDRFRLLVEKRYAHGQFIGYGDMLAAELMCGRDEHRAFLSKLDSHPEYFDETGAAMRKQLMRMPLQYGAVTSRFGRRRHPILGYTRAHNGVDYGVPIGTPVWSVGDGKVIRAGWGGGYGRLVEVQHANGWVSQYAHLSRIGVRVGQRVRQRQTVGLVGMTGLATGPHLHYGLKHNGIYVNSLAQHFERAKALTGQNLVAFQSEVKRLLGEMDKMQLAHEPSALPTMSPENGV